MTVEAGDPAPDFTLPDDSGNVVSLDDYRGKRLVLYFYPKAFTPGCTVQACDLRDNFEAFRGAGFEVVGVSPDPVARLARFREDHRLPFPLLSDQDHQVATAYGAYGTKTNYGRSYQGIIRSTFVIGPDGTVEAVWRNVNAKGHADRLMGMFTQ